jgi:hypothetical protein
LLALVDVSDAPNASTQTYFGGADRTEQRSGHEFGDFPADPVLV